jgi:hypothetical protein
VLWWERGGAIHTQSLLVVLVVLEEEDEKMRVLPPKHPS